MLNIVIHINDYYAPVLGEFELLVLLALLRLGNGAYGASILRDIRERTGREVAISPPPPPGPYPGLDQAKTAGATVLAYGHFFNTILSFVLVAFAVFILVRAIDRIRSPEATPAEEPKIRTCPYCAMDVGRLETIEQMATAHGCAIVSLAPTPALYQDETPARAVRLAYPEVSYLRAVQFRFSPTVWLIVVPVKRPAVLT